MWRKKKLLLFHTPVFTGLICIYIKSFSSEMSEIISFSTTDIHCETRWTLNTKQRKLKHWEHLDVVLPSKLVSCWWCKITPQDRLFCSHSFAKKKKRWRFDTFSPLGLKEVSRCAAEKSSALKSHQDSVSSAQTQI